MALPFTPLYIDGKWRPSSSGVTFAVCNPGSGKVVGTAASASAEDCVAACTASAQAFKTWEHTPLSVRRDVVLKAADILAGKKDKIIAATIEETASTEEWAWTNFAFAINQLRSIAATTVLLKGETGQSIIPGARCSCNAGPSGSCSFGIVPWNAPVTLAIRAAAIPIICGNTVILRTSEICPRTQAIVVEIFEEAGLPAGVLSCISTSKEDAPARTAEIIANPVIRKINFTGSDIVGAIIAKEAAKYLKPCVLELGGKAPAVVLNDADIPRAARAIASSALLNSGQVCMSTERVIVQKGVSDQLLKDLGQLFRHVEAGEPKSGVSSRIGAMFTKGSVENAINMIKDAVDHGAEVLVGNMESQGTVMQPHLLWKVKPGMRLWERESFAPVVVVNVFDTIEEAVELANNTNYSLAASVWTRDVYKAFDITSKIRACMTNINGPTMHVESSGNVGGLGGATGYGTFAIDDWTQPRTVILHPEQEPTYPLVGRTRD